MEAYAELSNSTSLSGSMPAIPIPFPFTLLGTTNDTVFLMFANVKISNSSNSPIFTPFGADIVNGTKSYEVSGAAGQRILKVQYKNMNFGHDFNVSDTINYQVWFFEEGNAIEVHFGSSVILNPVWSYYYNEGGPYIGVYHFIGTTSHNFTLKGNPASPVADTTTGNRLQGTPASGQVYRFEQQPNSIQEVLQSSVVVYPNPSNGSFYIGTDKHTGVDVKIWNAMGQRVYKKHNHNSRELLQTSLPPGLYLVEADGKREKVVVR